MPRTLGERIRHLRLANSYSQRELAKLVGTSAGLISFIERDRNRPNYEIVKKLALVFETTTDYLITGFNPNSPTTDDLLQKLRSEVSIKIPVDENRVIKTKELQKTEKLIDRVAGLSHEDQTVILKILDKMEK